MSFNYNLTIQYVVYHTSYLTICSEGIKEYIISDNIHLKIYTNYMDQIPSYYTCDMQLSSFISTSESWNPSNNKKNRTFSICLLSFHINVNETGIRVTIIHSKLTFSRRFLLQRWLTDIYKDSPSGHDKKWLFKTYKVQYLKSLFSGKVLLAAAWSWKYERLKDETLLTLPIAVSDKLWSRIIYIIQSWK